MTSPLVESTPTRVRFEFEFDSKYRAPLAALGVTPDNAWLELDDQELSIRFGLNRVRTRRTNLAHVRQSGPFRWWRAIGPRLSLADRGATFGTNTEAGVCLSFHSPVGILPGGRLRVPGLTLTVADPLALERALRDG